jgi:tryptophanyl-tRNA synthetase
MTKRQRILSGIQPTGVPHLGNYFGAIQQQIELQHEGDAFYFIADYHALTSVRDPEALRRDSRVVAATYLALGLDPEKATLFRQSDVPEVHEITWMLQCVTGMGVLKRAHSYKDKIANGINPNVGLFCYPALMAADILAYQSDIVPVGQDQHQHVEICQSMAKSFNAAYGEVFTIPEIRLSEASKVPGTDGRKMSKSYGNTIPIFAPFHEIHKAIMRIVTDSKDPRKEPLDPTNCNALNILNLLDPDEATTFAGRYLLAPENGFLGYGSTKKRIAEIFVERFGKQHQEFKRLMKPDSELDDILHEGGLKAQYIARLTKERCRQAVGLNKSDRLF